MCIIGRMDGTLDQALDAELRIWLNISTEKEYLFFFLIIKFILCEASISLIWKEWLE